MHPLFVVDRAEEGLEHPAEHLRLGELASDAAAGAVDARESTLWGAAFLRLELFDEVVGPKSLVAAEALHQRVREGSDVAGSLPHLLRQDDGGVKPNHVGATAHEGLPPLALDVLFEFDSEGSVVPR